MGINKRLINTGGAAIAPFDPLANFETVTYTGNGGTQAINGYIRKGAAFNGSSSVISIPLSIVSVGSAYSVSLWFNAVNVGINTGIFTNQGSSAISGQIAINLISSTQINVASIVNNGSNTVDAIAATVPTMSANDWNHLVVIGDRSLSNKVKLYLNGTEASNYSFNAGAGSNALYSTAQIGRSDNRFFNGKLDQIRFFNSSITQANVNTLKDETYASATKSTTDIFGNGSGVALYELDDNSLSSNFGQAAVFNGSSSRINTGFLQNGQVYGISFWAKNLNGDSIFRDTPSTGGGDTRMDVTVSATKGVALGGGINLIPSFTPSTNTWNHYAVSLNGSTAKIYANGTEVGSKSYTPRTGAAGSITPGSGNHPVCMMSNGLFAAGFGSGSLDQVRVYSSALSTADITKLYQESSQIPTTNLVSHYTLNGNALDSKGSNNGTETSITYASGVYGGTDIAINYLGMAFSPSLIWIKERGGNDRHILIDSIRGTNSQISSNNAEDETTFSSNLTSFDSNGFTLGSASESNGTNDTYVSWCWRAADSTTIVSANGNKIASKVRANVEAGFSITEYTSTSVGTNTIVECGIDTPELIIIKCTSTNSTNWIVAAPTILGGTNWYLSLNDNQSKVDAGSDWLTISNTTFALPQTFGNANANGRTYIAYSFKSISGYQKVGSYTGGGASNVTVSLGFEPRWIMVKGIANGYNWVIWDQVRKAGTVPYDNDFVLFANTSVAEKTDSTARGIQFTSTGFVLNQNNILSNDSGVTYIFLAIA